LSSLDGKQETVLLSRDDISLRGDHNVLNVLAACAITSAAGLIVLPCRRVSRDLPVWITASSMSAQLNGAAWYNDSIATAPERTMAAIRLSTEPLVLLIGGRDKKLPWEDLAELIRQRVDHVVVFGEAAPKILDALSKVQGEPAAFTIDHASGLNEAVQKAYKRSEPDDVVLLSPGGTSYDEFEDFEERGECFRNLVKNLQ
jgi:UDP-N-acetylmuramoylalanine--D-glutamate ligase